MSAGTLPLANYHRASAVGAGTFGSVVVVYNDDGEEYALKLFEQDDNDDDSSSLPILDLGVLREVSILRLLRHAHPNIVTMHDMQSDWHDDEHTGAGTTGCLSMALPLYPGSVLKALETGQLHDRPAKVTVAHGLLSAVHFLHHHGILHRDIKSDNVLLRDDGQPILIDFSLAKVVTDTLYNKTARDAASLDDHDETMLYEPTQHTTNVGTVGYTAPEILDDGAGGYGYPSDVYSVGVVLLEVLQNRAIQAYKHHQARAEVETCLTALPSSQPFPDLVRRMLQVRPAARPTCQQALQDSLFVKFGLDYVPPPTLRMADAMAPSLIADSNDNSGRENVKPNKNNMKQTSASNKKGTSNKDPFAKRRATIARACQRLEAQHPWTATAALEYSMLLSELDDELDDLTSSQGLLDCAVLAFRFFEFELLDFEELEEEEHGLFANWQLDNYADNEATLLMLADYCLLPRSI